jgi:hypothetical protein
MMLTSQETRTWRNWQFAFEVRLAWRIAVTPLFAVTAGLLQHGRHLDVVRAVWIDDTLTAEARSWTGTREIPHRR